MQISIVREIKLVVERAKYLILCRFSNSCTNNSSNSSSGGYSNNNNKRRMKLIMNTMTTSARSYKNSNNNRMILRMGIISRDYHYHRLATRTLITTTTNMIAIT